jgi:hypothetical protein
MSNFYIDTIQKDARFKSSTICKDVALLEPVTRAAALAVVADARAQGHDVRIAETYRSPARQQMLFREGYTQLKNVGCHGYGVAFDVQLFAGGKYVSDGQKYAFLLPIAKKQGLIWGGDWGTPHAPHSFRDWDHFQRVPVFRQAALFSGQWYPPENYEPYADMAANHIAGM